MTVKLLRAFGGFAEGALYDGDADTELSLVLGGNAQWNARNASSGGGPGSLGPVNTSLIMRPSSPGLALTTGTELGIGVYSYCLTYVTADGETEGGFYASITTTSGNQAVILTLRQHVPIDGGTSPVIARKIYRSVVGDTTLGKQSWLVATIADNTTTTYEDRMTDAAMGSAFADHIPQRNTTGGSLKALYDGSADGGSYGFGVPGLIEQFAADTTSIRIGYGAAAGHKAYNTLAIGIVALEDLTTGTENIAIGNLAGNKITSGADNVLLGYKAGSLGTVVKQMTAVGSQAGVSITADGNTAIGFYAAESATTAAYGVYIGHQCGDVVLTGSSNVFVGKSAGTGASQLLSAAYTIGIGRGAWTNRNNQLVLGSADATFGIFETIMRGPVRISTGADASQAAPNANAALDLGGFTTKALLLPAVSTATRDGMSTPTAGLLLYNSTTNKLNFRAASAWEAVTSA